MKPSLIEQLAIKESEFFGNNTNPITSNIKTRLIPVADRLLNSIPAYMPEYTLHDINHCERILAIINNIIPQHTELNIIELTILIYSVYLHDIGMVINREEAQLIKATEDFKKLFIEFDKDTNEDEILTEYIRRNHVKNSLNIIDKFKSYFETFKIDFSFAEVDLSPWIKNVILSHGSPVEALKDPIKFPSEKLIHSYQVDIQYLAILLRLGDILDFDIFRTPPFLYKHINPKNQISIEEWQKHQSIEGILINSSLIKIEAFCKSAKIERLVREFIKWIDRERMESIALMAATQRNFKLELINPVEFICRNDDTYLYTEMQIKLDYEKILHILMGTELYDSPDIFLREILQNAYDACKSRSDLLTKQGEIYKANISLTYNSSRRELKIEDNGIGIDKDVFENYVIAIGKSYYKSKTFQVQEHSFTPISNFGIGIISCFMVTDTIEIESLKYYSPLEKTNPIHYILNVNQKFVDERKGSKNSYGTCITMKLKNEYAEKLMEKPIIDIIKENMAYQELPIKLSIDNKIALLDNDKIKVPEDYKTFNNILIFELNEEQWIEGFLIIHQNKHQTIIEQSKVSQQCFTITTKNKGFPLNIPWLQFVKFFINIRPPKRINLKANRNKIQEDESFIEIKNYLVEFIVKQFRKQENFLQLGQFINDARGNVLSGNKLEYEFLIETIPFNCLTSFTTGERKVFKQLRHQIKGQRVAVVHPDIFNYHSGAKRKNLEFLFKKYKLIVLHDFFIQYFYQFSKPYLNYHDIIVTDVSGMVFYELSFKDQVDLDIYDYDLQYSWNREYEISYKGNKSSLFFVIGNNQYNSLDFNINENHILGKLLKQTNKTSHSKRFLASLKTFFSISLEQGKKMHQYSNSDGEYHYMFSNNGQAFSLKTVHCLESDFIDSLNTSMTETLLKNLVNEGYIDSKDSDKYLLSKSDFPSWWFNE